MYKRAPKTNAQLKLERIRAINEQKIDLYPKEEKKSSKSILESVREKEYKVRKARDLRTTNFQAFKENAQRFLVHEALYYGVMNPVLNEQLANSHERKIASRVIYDFLDEHSAGELINNWRNKSIYLAEFASAIDNTLYSVLEEAKDKIKEGLPEKDAFDIEDEKINNMILDIKDVVPKDITKMIADRVEDSVNDFVDTNKKHKFEIKKIYDSAKEKIDRLNAQQEEEDQDHSKIIQDSPEDIEQAQQEAIRFAKGKERQLLESDCNVLDSMVRIVLESVHTNDVLKEAYSTDYNKINIGRIVNDTKTMYTFLECLNTLNIVPMDGEVIKDILTDMKSSK